jgi:molybdopterin converting factor subunit 1
MITVHARFFALYRERVGNPTLDIPLDDGATVADAVAWVMRRYPGFSPNPPKIVVAVDREYVNHNHPLKHGNELAFIPPVSGG